MITNIELTEQATQRFNDWIARVGKKELNIEAVAIQAMNRFHDDLSIDCDPGYELGSQFTITGRPECIEFSRDDFIIDEETDE